METPPSQTIEEPETVESTGSATKLAPHWKVILHDDDTTTMDFVVEILKSIFHKEQAEAHRLMMEVHTTGSALITVTTYERAELYVDQVRSKARPRGFPLTATMEPA